MRRRLATLFLSFLAALLLALGGGLVWLMQADLRPILQSWAEDSLGRQVSLGQFEIGWGDPMSVRLRDLRIANAPWGSVPEMVSLHSLDAEIDRASLWNLMHGGVPVYRHLRAEGLKVVLERNESGIGNWKIGSGVGGGGIVPQNRTQFPTLTDMMLADALVTYRTYSGNIIRIGLDQVAIAAPDDSSPVSLKAEGAYNNTPLTLTATTDSFRRLRDASHPFGTELVIAGRTARVDFSGTMMEPLDVDGAEGALRLDAPELANLLAAFGGEISAPYALWFDSHLVRQGDNWKFTGIEGDIADMPFTGNLDLIEGHRGEADDIRADLSFQQLTIDRLLTEMDQGPTDWRAIRLPTSGEVGVKLDLALAAQSLAYHGIRLGSFSGKARLNDALATLEDITFLIGGGQVTGTLRMEGAGEASRVALDASVSELDAGRLVQEFGASAGDIAGRIDGVAALTSAGLSVGDMLRQANGEVLLGLRDGRIKESIIERASTDLRALFREGSGSTPLDCFGLRASFAEGKALINPLRLQAEGASLAGGGQIDLNDGGLDLRLVSDRSESGFFALDLPLVIGGTLAAPSAGLASGETAAAALPIPSDSDLTPAMRQLRAENPCLD